MKPTLVTKEEFKVVGFKITCDWSLLSTEIPKLWNELNQRISEIVNKSNEYLIDINLEVKGNEFTELICVEVDDFKDVPNGMIGMNIPTQTYACTNHNGKVEDIWRSFGELQKWIVEIGQTVDPTDFKMDFSLDDSTSPHILYQKIL